MFGRTVATFRYLQISLARLAPHAYDYLQTENILMGRSLRGTRRAQLYFVCLRRLLDAERAGEVNRAALQLLGAVIDTYLPRARELSAGQGARRGVGAYGIRPWSRMRGRLPYSPVL